MKRVFSLLLVLLLVVGLMPVQTMADEFDDYFGNGDDNVLYVMLAVMTEDYLPVGEGYYTIMQSAGTNVDLKNYVPAGYTIVSVQVAGDTSQFTVDGDWCFTMPNAPGELLAFVAPDNGGSTPQPPQQPTLYNVYAKDDIENGTISVDKSTASTGDTVTITVAPNPGYKLSWITVYNAEADGIEFDATPNGDGTYSFVVQNFDITIGGGFEPDSGTDPQPPQQPDPQPPQQTTKYTVTVNPVGSGTASANVSEAAYGDTVTITTVPGEGNWAQGIQGDQTNTHNPVEINRNNDNYDNFVFTMPEDDVEITVVFGPYPTIMPEAGEGGKLEDVPDSAKPGTTVTFTPQPNAGYRVKEVIIGSDNNGTVTPTKKNDGSYEFTMPPSNVTITVIFEEAVTVTFDANGGKVGIAATSTEVIPLGGKLPSAPLATREGYTFLGWFSAQTDGTRIDKDTVFNTDTTVYAHWEKVIIVEHITEPEQNNSYGAKLDMTDGDVLKKLLGDETATEDTQVWMTVAKLADAPSTEKQAIEDKAASDKLATYLDIKLFKKVGNRNAETISNTNGPVTITMTLDAGVVPANAESVYIVYYHGGAKTIPASYNHSTRVLTFQAREFSTYALAYKVRAAATASVGTLDNVPKTGDGAPLMGYSLLVLCSAAMLAAVAFFDRKRVR